MVIVALWFVIDLRRLALEDDKIAFKVFIQNHWVGLIVLIVIAVDLQFSV